MSAPVAPSTFYSDLLARRTADLARTAQPAAARGTGAPPELIAAAGAELARRQPDLAALSRDIHAFAEPAFAEQRSADRIVALLQAADHTVERPVAGLDTAFRAEAGSGGRRIGICAEYDALPGLGHACGHNVIATAAVGAFLSAARALRESGRPGTVVLYGTPAEEGHSGKELMLRGGAFAELDAAIMLHSYDYDCAEQVWLGRRTLRIGFHGVSAHASSAPYAARNALDAAALCYQGIGLLRQQIPPCDRIHAIISEGGRRASIIPDSAQLEGYVRSPYTETLRDLAERVDAVARGAALMTGCGVDVEWDDQPPTLPVRHNQALLGRWALHEQARGRLPLPRGVVDEGLAASTDFGNVSCLVPGIHPLIKVAPTGTALHTREFAAAAGSDAGVTAALDGAFGLAGTALDFLCDDALARAVRDEFDATGPVRAADVFGGAA